MNTIDQLKHSAEDSAKFRKHTLVWLESRADYAYGECSECNMGVTCRTNPLPNQVDIAGELVAVNCEPSRKFKAFDIESEYDVLYFPRVGQMRKLRPEFTREQAQQFFNWKNAVHRAQKIKYSTDKDNDYSRWTVQQTIDDIIKGGYSIVVEKPFGVIELHKTDQTGIRVFKRTVECDYIRTLLRMPVKAR